MGRITATIAEHSPRADVWMKAFGTLTLPITTAEGWIERLPGTGDRLMYYLDIAALSAEQIERAAAYYAEFVREPIEVVRAELLAEHRMPLYVDADVTLTVDAVTLACAFREAGSRLLARMGTLLGTQEIGKA